MSPKTERQGEIFALTSSLLWALIFSVAKLSFAGITPILSVAISIGISSIFFAAMITVRGKWGDLRIRKAWKYVLLGGVINGAGFHGLLFLGLNYTTAGNGAVIALMELFFSYIFLSVLLKHEYTSPRHLLGACLMITGALLILLPKTDGMHWGDMIILLATAIAPFGNRFQQCARNLISSEMVMFLRNIFAGSILLSLSLILEDSSPSIDLNSALIPLLINGFVIFGVTKILWLEAIHRISITKATSLSSIQPFFALVIAFILLHEIPTLWQIASAIPIAAGVIFLTTKKKQAVSIE